MPFTLAHPAAVLPLKRYCPRQLDFAALVVGSMCPDAAYFSGRYHLEDLSHRFMGGFTFDLPVGIMMLTGFYLLRGAFVVWLPETFRRVFQPLCEKPIASPPALLASLVIGIWTHLFWDSFTHTHGWLVLNVHLLQIKLASPSGHPFEVCHLLWYLSSFGGVAWICFAYERWCHAVNPAGPPFNPRAAWCHALMVGALVLPIEAMHHLLTNLTGLLLTAACSLLLVTSVVWLMARTLGARRPG